jgi:hypothetical protein
MYVDSVIVDSVNGDGERQHESTCSSIWIILLEPGIMSSPSSVDNALYEGCAFLRKES